MTADPVPSRATRAARRLPATVLPMLAALSDLAAAVTGAGRARLQVGALGDPVWGGRHGPLPEDIDRTLEPVYARASAIRSVDSGLLAAPPAAAGFSVACVPVPVDARPGGSLAVFHPAPRAAGAADLSVLEHVAGVAGRFVRFADRHDAAAARRAAHRKLACRVATVDAVGERERAFRLHEAVANDLVGAALLTHSLAGAAGAVGQDTVREVQRHLEATLATVRDLAYQNVGYLVESYGFSHALATTLRRLAPVGPVRCGVIAEAGAGAALPAAVARHLVQLAEAALRLALGDPTASRVTVRLRSAGPAGVQLRVAADAAWLRAKNAPDWDLVRFHARVTGAELREHFRADGGDRLTVVLRGGLSPARAP